MLPFFSGADYKSTLSIKIPKADLVKFHPNGADFYNGKIVIATGRITREKKYLRLIVTNPADLQVIP